MNVLTKKTFFVYIVNLICAKQTSRLLFICESHQASLNSSSIKSANESTTFFFVNFNLLVVTPALIKKGQIRPIKLFRYKERVVHVHV